MFMWLSLTQVPDYNDTIFSIICHWLFTGGSTLYHHISLELFVWNLTFCMDLTFVIGNNNRKFHDGTMMGT